MDCPLETRMSSPLSMGVLAWGCNRFPWANGRNYASSLAPRFLQVHPVTLHALRIVQVVDWHRVIAKADGVKLVEPVGNVGLELTIIFRRHIDRSPGHGLANIPFLDD